MRFASGLNTSPADCGPERCYLRDALNLNEAVVIHDQIAAWNCQFLCCMAIVVHLEKGIYSIYVILSTVCCCWQDVFVVVFFFQCCASVCVLPGIDYCSWNRFRSASGSAQVFFTQGNNFLQMFLPARQFYYKYASLTLESIINTFHSFFLMDCIILELELLTYGHSSSTNAQHIITGSNRTRTE